MMNTADFYLSLDIHETNAQAALRVKKGDTARRLLISLTENGKPYDITADCSAVFTAKKPDGNLLYNACTVTGNRIVYPLTPQTTAAAGEVACELRLYGANSALITSPRFLLLVDDTVYSDGDVVESTSEFSALVQMLEAVKTLKAEIESALQNGDFKGDTGETSLPVARASSSDGVAYTATDSGSGCVLPVVAAADSIEQISAVGKGRQIVFIPWVKNQSTAPTLQLNGGEIIPIRIRAPKNQDTYDDAPTATLPVSAGALMRGVPYTMTFCGKYWLLDSQIAQFSCAANEYQASVMRALAEVAAGMKDADIIGMPIINSTDGIAGDVSRAFIKRSAAEDESPPEDGSVRLPTEQRVEEMIRKDITADYAAWSPEDGTAKTVENYAKTLPDGSYRVANDTIGYLIDTLTVYGYMQWRIIREYDDEFCYISLYCGDYLGLYIDTEVGYVQSGGRTLLTNENIPYPTAADVGKVLTASAAGKAGWTAVTNAEEVAY